MFGGQNGSEMNSFKEKKNISWRLQSRRYKLKHNVEKVHGRFPRDALHPRQVTSRPISYTHGKIENTTIYTVYFSIFIYLFGATTYSSWGPTKYN